MDNSLFSSDEIRYMRNEGRRSKIIKIIIICLLVATIGGIVYTLHNISSGAAHSRSNITAIDHSTYGTKQEKVASPTNTSTVSPGPTDQRVNPSKNTTTSPKERGSRQSSLPVTPTIAQGCQQNPKALAQMKQILAKQDKVAAQMGHIGDEEAQGYVYDPSNGISYSSELTSLEEEADSLQQQYNVAQSQLGC